MDDDLDLDALLLESTKLAAAKKAASQNRRLTPEQLDILDANNLAADAALWRDVKVYRVIESIWCAGCGDNVQVSLGNYIYQEQRSGNQLKSRRMIRSAAGKAAAIFFKNVEVAACAYCGDTDLPVTLPGECDLLDAL